MDAKVLIIAVVAVLVALPVPATQMLAAGPAGSRSDIAAGGVQLAEAKPDISVLFADPFAAQPLSIDLPTRFTTLETGVDPFSL